ncbi:MAG: ABC transporter substrate-binding protein [Pseudomonadota bacterium]
MKHGPFTSRRQTLALLGGAAALPLLPGSARADLIPTLALYGPPAGPSITLAHAAATDALADVAHTATVTAWRNPDELRAGLTSGEIALSVVPVQAAANLYNRGFPLRLANVMTNGLLYIISEDPQINSIPDLAGRTIAVPFRGDTPEIIFGQLLAHHGMEGEAAPTISYAASPIEAMQLLLAGRVEAALTAEPSTTAGILRGRQAEKTVRRAISIQEEWGAMTGAAPVLPQAGLAVTNRFMDEHGAALPAILTALEGAVAGVNENPEAAAADATGPLGTPAPLLAASIPHSNLVARPAKEARADVERMLSAMAGADMARLGGKMPDDGFFL